MTEESWLAGNSLSWLLSYAEHHAKVGNRKLRLFGCACCRRVWRLIPDPRWRAAVEVLERYSDRQLTKAEALAAIPVPGSEYNTSASVVFPLSRSIPFIRNKVYVAAHNAQCAVAGQTGRRRHRVLDSEEAAQCGLLREIVGNPFRPLAVLAAWRTPTIRSLARAAYEDGCLPEGTLDTARLSVLADALEDAGCDESIPMHLRSPGPHFRGCWALDLILAKGR